MLIDCIQRPLTARLKSSRGNAPTLHGKIVEEDYVKSTPPNRKTTVFVRLRVETDYILDDSKEVFFQKPDAKSASTGSTIFSAARSEHYHVQ